MKKDKIKSKEKREEGQEAEFALLLFFFSHLHLTAFVAVQVSFIPHPCTFEVFK